MADWIFGQEPGSLRAGQRADRTTRGKDGDTNVHSHVAAIRYHVGSQSEASKPLESCNGNGSSTKLDK